MPALTSLRMLAAWLVFLYHFPPQSQGLAAIVGREGHVGVTVFFVLSGFLITVRYYEGLALGQVSLREYFGKRVARILPLYFTVLGLSLFLAGRPLFTWDTLPEWTLTHGFFARSMEHLTVPTSWTLSIEECFYALAPVVFFTLRRAPLLHGNLGQARGRSGWTLLAWTAALAGAGFLVYSVADGERFGFLGSTRTIVSHTIFGRFVDFAVGIAAGLFFLSGRPARVFSRSGGAWRASAGALLGMALVVAGEAGMFRAGGIEGGSWGAAWPFNGLVILGSALLILCLTSGDSFVSRVLAFPLFVYLGRISYALYLVQMTPVGKGLLYRLLPGDSPWFVPALYVGMSLVSALLFELVEEPGRRAITRLVRAKAGREGPAAEPILPGAATVLIVALALGVQATAWSDARLSERHGPPTAPEVGQALGRESPRILVVPTEAAGPPARVRMPSSWLLGAESDRRAPPSVLVFAGGAPVPFLGVIPEGEARTQSPIAYYRRPRTEFVELNLGDARPAEIVIVRHDPGVALALHLQRLVSSPKTLLLWGALLGAALALALALSPFRRLRAVAAVSLAAVTVLALAAGLHELALAPALVAAQMLVLLALRQRAASRERRTVVA
jgi:peptidoglycan/LPS O-acetylase OafA/YrhL